ncbi:uncharacterized protein LOC112081475 [Eutrema salsugineum]|uniref:uncharacterized protein LOC112081475 n=1 Tax=Eutrema salsugineum TaxID=72664 RepID=UPI000CED6044|nr:uncharacterized protein LOC112081475 [Eutrema salsugineum]
MAPDLHQSSGGTSQQMDQYENHYYLHSSDHAGLILVSDRLTTGTDFHSWRRSVRMALNVRNKLGFIDGTIPKPRDGDRDAGSWSRCNDMVATWLMNSVSKKIGQSLLFISTASGIWKNLLARFKQDDAPRIFEIEQRLSNIHQGSLDVSSYYTELITLWEEYNNYVELPVCTRGKCECNAATQWESMQLRSRVIKFLMGLNECYESIRRHILVLKPIPSIEDAYNMVAQDERQKSMKPTRPENVVFQSSGPTQSTQDTSENVDYAAYALQNNYRPKTRPVCTHCGQTGHVIQRCFKLHGYPPGYIPGYKSASSAYNQGQRPFAPTQPQSQPRGQFPAFQPRGRFESPRPQVVANMMTDAYPYMPPPAQSPLNLDFSNMNPEQVQTLIQQLSAQVKVSDPTDNPSSSAPTATITEHGIMAAQSSSGIIPFPSSSLRFENDRLTFQHKCLSTLYNNLPPGSWIIDSGATCHVCFDLALFSDIVSVSGITVSLPNGHREEITHTGTESIQGLMIGRGHLIHNLYILQLHNPPSSAFFSRSVMLDNSLWHQRLGHPSYERLAQLSNVLPLSKSSKSSESHCQICPLAKQKRLPFESNNHMSSLPFDLLHLDIWGPFNTESVEGYRLPSALLKNKTPYELLLKKTPDYSFLRSFGCLCYVSTLQKDRNKFSPRADQCVFLGYSTGYKGYKVLHLDSNLISVSRNVVFHESTFPFATISDNHSVDIFQSSILPLPIPAVLDEHVTIPHSSSSHIPDMHHSSSPDIPPSHTSSSASQSPSLCPGNTSNPCYYRNRYYFTT